MIQLTSSTPIFVAAQPADFRCGIDGFVALCKQQLAQEPRTGAVFVFINRRHTQIRALRYDGNGFWLMTKRLSQGKFDQWPRTNSQAICQIQAAQLRALLKTTL